MPKIAIHWFRRDLRIGGNPALQWAREAHRGRVLGFFCFDPKFLSRPDFGPARFQFFIDTLLELRIELRRAGGDLLVFDEGPETAFVRLVEAIRKKRAFEPICVSFNRDYEPFARARDGRVTDLLRKQFGLNVVSERDHLLIEPAEIAKDDGGFYQIYTPFQKRWLAKFREPEVRTRIEFQKMHLARADMEPRFRLRAEDVIPTELVDSGLLERYRQQNALRVAIPTPRAGMSAARARLKQFAERIDRYTELHDIPGIDGSSRLSIYFKNGSLTVAEAIAYLDLHPFKKADRSGAAKYFSELIWREFYYHILWHRPDVEHGAFLAKYRSLEWENREKYLEAWKAGRTGFPIVDAGMRQLNSTGWMHNRVRMIVASFLCKDLLIDWREGERYFMEKLLDGDLAPNNGGWQWAASTGCDPQPYFRIFNPFLQSKKFDPQGRYIRTFVPELRAVSDRQIHSVEGCIAPGYPKPIVVHAEQKTRSLRMYRAAHV